MKDAHNIHILLVEDYKPNILIVSTLLEEFGYDYTVATSGKEAIGLIKNQLFSLVLMDVQMPEMDGLETTALIRHWEKEQGARRVPIIGITAHALIGDRARCLDAGMDDYLAKPYQLDELIKKIKDYAFVSRYERTIA